MPGRRFRRTRSASTNSLGLITFSDTSIYSYGSGIAASNRIIGAWLASWNQKSKILASLLVDRRSTRLTSNVARKFTECRTRVDGSSGAGQPFTLPPSSTSRDDPADLEDSSAPDICYRPREVLWAREMISTSVARDEVKDETEIIDAVSDDGSLTC